LIELQLALFDELRAGGGGDGRTLYGKNRKLVGVSRKKKPQKIISIV
jgi:hypothetical protein